GGGGPADTSEGVFTILTNTVWKVDRDAPAGGDGLTWATAFQHPQDAMDVASPADEVWVAEGAYAARDAGDTVLLTLVAQVEVYGGFAGTESSRGERDWRARATGLDGQGGGEAVVEAAANSVLDGFTVTGGPGGLYGAGLRNQDVATSTVANCLFTQNVVGMGNYDSAPLVRDCVFEANAADGMRNRFSRPRVEGCRFAGNGRCGMQDDGSRPTVTDCVFTENVWGAMRSTMASSPVVTDSVFLANTAEDGGAVYCDWGSATLTRCVFESNAALDVSPFGGTFHGGAVYCDRSALAVSDCVFTGNSAVEDGGAIYGYQDSSIAVTGSRFVDNTAYRGGAICSFYSLARALWIQNCSFAGCNATLSGGALYLERGSPEFAGCVFEGNSADWGGAVYSYADEAAFTNCTFNANAATRGGVLYSSRGSSQPAFTNCTLAGNSATSYGGAAYNVYGQPAFVNSILWGNSAPTGPEIYDSSTGVSTAAYSCVAGGYAGTGNIGTDPLLADAANDLLYIEPGSPCIDAADGDTAPLLDMDGRARYDDPATDPDTGTGVPTYCDMGAYEFAEPMLSLTAPAGGELWRTGSGAAVDWYSQGINFARIELSRDGGETWEEIAASVDATARTHPWTVTGPLSAHCLVRLTNAEGGPSSATSADEFTIGDGAWRVDCDAPEGGDGLTWATAFKTVHDGLARAPSGDEVWVAEGSYFRSHTAQTVCLAMKEGVAIYGGFAGTESARVDRDPAARLTALDGEGVCLHVVVGASNATFDGFIVTRGRADGDGIDEYGAGMLNDGVTGLTVAGCVFAVNSATEDGGGIYNTGADVTVTACRFDSNSAYRGGGVANNLCSPMFTDTDFVRNEAYSGGGMLNFDSASPTVAGCVFQENYAYYGGGGIRDDEYSSSTLGGCLFTGNIGRGYAASDHCNGLVTDCIFRDNVGCGVFCERSAGPTFVNCVIVANQGGAACYGASPTFRNCTFTRNTAPSRGGALYLASSGGVGSSAILRNCILWGDFAAEYDEIYVDGLSTCTASYSCIAGGHAGAGNIDADPLFYDAVTGRVDLREGSPCIDAADGLYAPAGDVDGNARYDDPATEPNTGVGTPPYADIGACEFQGAAPGSWVDVLEPLDGAAFAVGADVEIRWTTSVDILNVAIDISRSGGPWEPIAASTPNDGSHTWTVDDGSQALPQSGCLIRVSDAGAGTAEDVSGGLTIMSGVWYVRSDAAPGGDGLSWATAFRHPQDAADVAGAGHEIWIKKGTYVHRELSGSTVLRMADGVAVHGGFAGSETDLAERISDPAETVLDGAEICRHVVFGADGAHLEMLTVSGGRALGYSVISNGAGVVCERASMSMSFCNVTDNVGSGNGGGIYVSGGSLIADHCVFTGNGANSGGGASLGSCDAVDFIDCEFTDNTGYGGGIYASSCTWVGLSRCTISQNLSEYGGGALSAFFATLQFDQCVVQDNWSGYDGGAIYNRLGSIMAVSSEFRGNVADRDGGAIYSYDDSTLALENTVFVSNSASDDGGAVLSYDNTVTTATNCSFFGNTAGGAGGTFSNAMNSSPILANCILWGGSAAQGPEVFDDAGCATTITYSCVQGGFAGAGNIAADPLFADEPAGDLHLLAGSPCIDAADGDAAPALDADGDPRVDDPAAEPNTGTGTPPYADIGAYER
ncbi:MAG: right-handed parallel beta-helix repeat-containing protein, partial [Planctomycetota bacterium]